MAAAGQDRAAATPALARQLSDAGSHGRAEPMNERKLSLSYSFSSAVGSLASSSPPRSSFESIPVPELDRQSSSSSGSSYESLHHYEAAAPAEPAGHDIFVPAMEPPAVQTMIVAQGQQQDGAGGYDPARLPQSMFRTRSKLPDEWTAAINESLFSIQLGGQPGEVGDLYYDAAGVFHRMLSAERDDSTAPSVSKPSTGGDGGGGGLCVKDDCARCESTNGRSLKYTKSVRFAATASIFRDSKRSLAFPTLDQEAPAGKETAEEEARWRVFGCCWPCGQHRCAAPADDAGTADDHHDELARQ